jgi:hypothetical protein
MYRDAHKIESFGAKTPVPIGRLKALLGHLGITSTPRYRIKGVLRPGWVEFRVVAEIFNETWITSRHQGPTFRASISKLIE